MSPHRRRVLVISLLGVYLLLALSVAVHSPVDTLDQAIFHWTHRHFHNRLVLACRAVNIVFAPRDDVVVASVVAAVVSWQRRSWRPLRESALLLVVLGICVEGSKIAIGRPGPGDLASRELQGAYPSGHAAAALVCGAVVLVLLRLDRERSAQLVLVALTVLLLGTLIYAHFHFLSDIVGSWLVVAAVLLALAPRLRRSVHV